MKDMKMGLFFADASGNVGDLSQLFFTKYMKKFLPQLFSLVICAFTGAMTVQAQVTYELYDFGILAGLADNPNSAKGARVFVKLSPNPVPASLPKELSLADRVAYQRAIERVYWRHRIWPRIDGLSQIYGLASRLISGKRFSVPATYACRTSKSTNEAFRPALEDFSLPRSAVWLGRRLLRRRG